MLAGSAAGAGAADALSLSGPAGSPTAVSVAPGGTFSITATLTTDRPFNGLTFFLENPGAAPGGPGPLTITARASLPTNPLEDATSTDGQVASAADAAGTPAGPDNALNARNDRDLGYGNADVSANEAAGTYNVITFTLAVAGSAVPGPYTVRTAGAVLTDAGFNEFAIPDSGGYTVVVAPEPGSLAAVALTAGGLLARRRRPKP